MVRIEQLIAVFFFALTFWATQGQSDENPAVWSHEVNKVAENEYDLIFKAKIFKDWYMYSQYTAEGGSMPSDFTFEKEGIDYSIVGPTKESKTFTKYSDVFEIDETFFKECLATQSKE